MFIWSANGCENILRNERPKEAAREFLELYSGLDMTVTGRVLLRSWEAFTVNRIAADVPDGVTCKAYFACDEVFSDKVPYPDRLVPVEALKELSVPAHCTQSVFFVFDVSSTAPIGKNGITLHIETSEKNADVNWALNIFPVQLPSPADSDILHEYFFDIFSCFGEGRQYAYPVGSKQWENTLIAFAQSMKALRINSLRLPFEIFFDSFTDGKFDFSLADRVTELFLKNGSFRYITVSHFCNAVTGGKIFAPDGIGGKRSFDIGTKEADDWAEFFLTSVYGHFKEKGWLPMLRMHIQDEPHSCETWRWAHGKCKKYMPGVPCGDPLDTHSVSVGLDGECDFYIPRFEVYATDPDFYHHLKQNGAELWCYCCCYPEEFWWLNHFIDQPLIYPRLISWACFSQHMDGFLHWGFNFWGTDMYGLSPLARFKGDGYIIYPGDGATPVYPSARYLATLEGMEDWELLKLAQAKNIASAQKLSESIAKDFSHFSTDASLPDKARKAILTKLSK